MLFDEDPSTSAKKQEREFKRIAVPYEYKSEKFHFQAAADYSNQYCHIYSYRLAHMKTLLEKRVREKWGDKYPLKEICDLRENNPEHCVIIGTLYKHQELKPSVLREISESHQQAPPPPRHSFFSDKDKLILEDDLQRILLVGEVDAQSFVTGVVCAVLGYVEGDGRFAVDELLFYEGGPQKSLTPLDDSPLMVIMSGINIALNPVPTSLDLLQQWIFGNLDVGNDRDWEAARICRLIIAGNSVRDKKQIVKRTMTLRQKESSETLDAVKSLDTVMLNLTKSVNVDIMPGEFDPSNFMLPQQRMHPLIFPKCAPFKSFNSVPNPYHFELAGRTIMGTSGQNVVDIDRYSTVSDPLDGLRKTLIWSHLAPTCPDTLSCYPFYKSDPFIIEECPHVYFAGNMAKFETELYESGSGNKTRLICVPSFSETQTVVVVNLRTLDCKEMSFNLEANLDELEE